MWEENPLSSRHCWTSIIRVFVRPPGAGSKVNKKLDISHIYVGALENIPWDRYSLLESFKEMCSLEVNAVRSNFARRCCGPWDIAHLARPLCLFAALRPLWLVNDDVLSQQTISLLNTSFSLLMLYPCRSRAALAVPRARPRSPGRIHLVNSANAYLLCVGNVMEQMRLELSLERMSGHGTRGRSLRIFSTRWFWCASMER